MKYNAACNAGMDLSHFRMLIHELLNKDIDIDTKAAPLIILVNKSAVCLAKNGKDTKHTKYIATRVHLVRNDETCKMYKILWCEWGLKLVDIVTKNVAENDLNARIEYIMVRLGNRERYGIILTGKS